MNRGGKRNFGASLIEFFDLYLAHELGARDFGTVNDDGCVLREKGVNGAVQICLVGGLDDRRDVVLGPLGEGWEDDVGGTYYVRK